MNYLSWVKVLPLTPVIRLEAACGTPYFRILRKGKAIAA